MKRVKRTGNTCPFLFSVYGYELFAAAGGRGKHRLVLF